MDVYYTNDHEWIDFRGTIACTGVCSFKLLGFKEIQQVRFCGSLAFLKRGDVIATIKYNDYQVEAHMPVEGKIIEFNEVLLAINPDILRTQPESAGWIAMIVPARPYDRKDLLLAKQYQMNGKSKYAK